MAPLAGKYFDVGDAEVRDNWDKKVFRQHALKTVFFNPENKLIGDKPTNMVQRKKEVFSEGGTRATITLVKQLTGKPTYGNQTMRDREEGVDTDTYRFEIQKIRHAVRVDGEIAENRVTWNIIETSSMLLGEWFAKNQEAAAAMHLTGFNIDAGRPTTEPWLDGTDLGQTWGNAPVPPDGDHYIKVNDKIPDNYLATDYLDLTHLDDAVALAATYPQPLRPIRIYGDDYFIWLVHPYAVRHWKNDGARWWQLATAAMQGGLINGNPIVRGTLGVYENVLIMAWPYLPPAINDAGTAVVANTRFAALCGQQALLYGCAKRYPDENTFKTVTEKWDYADKTGVEGHTIGGLACPDFNFNGTDQRFSTIVMSGYAKDLITPS
jgi:N4-gp56 family major capsid protein